MDWSESFDSGIENNDFPLIEELINFINKTEFNLPLFLNSPNEKGEYLLHKAVKRGNVPIITVLLQHRSDPNIEDKDKNLPLFLACKLKQNSTKICALLFENGVPVNQRDSQGNSVLHLQEVYTNPNYIEFFVHKGFHFIKYLLLIINN